MGGGKLDVFRYQRKLRASERSCVQILAASSSSYINASTMSRPRHVRKRASPSAFNDTRRLSRGSVIFKDKCIDVER